jgi:hypothetical protein
MAIRIHSSQVKLGIASERYWYEIKRGIPLAAYRATMRREGLK